MTCNNKASIEERKELVKYGGKVVMILLAAVVGIKLFTTALGIPFPNLFHQSFFAIRWLQFFYTILK